MKKLSVLLIAILAFSINSFAKQGNEYNALWALKNRAVADKISDFVKATPDQKDQLSDIYYISVQRLTDALSENDAIAAENALYFNIANVKAVLSKDQFKKYLEILNKTYFERNFFLQELGK